VLAVAFPRYSSFVFGVDVSSNLVVRGWEDGNGGAGEEVVGDADAKELLAMLRKGLLVMLRKGLLAMLRMGLLAMLRKQLVGTHRTNLLAMLRKKCLVQLLATGREVSYGEA